MYIHRDLEAQLTRFLKRKETIAIIGPRQSGKTTLLQYIKTQQEREGRKVAFLTFEKRSDLELFQEDIETFKNLHQNFQTVIIDEFQYAKEGGKKLKYLFDTTKTKFLISGSSSLDLTFQTGKYMVGRMISYTLMPFSFREFLASVDQKLFQLINTKIPENIFLRPPQKITISAIIKQELHNSFESYLRWGGYPAAVLAKNSSEKQRILENIIENYLLKDIHALLQLATSDELLRLTKFLATQIGNLVEYQELSKSSGLAYPSLLRHIEILKQTYIIDLVKPFFTNRRTELVKNPKVYFIDTGLRNAILSDFRPMAQRNDVGALVENAILQCLKKYSTPFEAPRFWRTKSKAEVDFIIQLKNEIIPIESKYEENPTPGKSFYSFIEKFSPKRAFLITKNTYQEKKIKKCRVIFIPAYFIS